MIFVDTGAWIALTDVSDHYHQEAVHIYTRLKQEKAHFVTTDYVLGESVTRLRYDAGHHIAIQFLDALIQAQEARILQTIHIEKSLFDQAVTIFRQYDSAVLSFTDCVSFVVCKQHKIQEAFAFDQHFTMMGIALCSP
jgi:predicted nucleic acid-binding protein